MRCMCPPALLVFSIVGDFLLWSHGPRVGVYSAPGEPTSQGWVPGYGNMLDAIWSCHTYEVLPEESSRRGDVVDAEVLWSHFTN